MTRTLDPARLTRIQRWADRYTQEAKFAGLSVLIRQGGDEVFYAQSGLRDLENGAAFDRDTIARIYSMTKPVTSLILMMLVEEGRLHLDAPLSRFLPEFADPRALRPGASDLSQTEP
ncbi:MAG: serine hydrolase domain-containing protein, partial [Tateyamaria sp.]